MSNSIDPAARGNDRPGRPRTPSATDLAALCSTIAGADILPDADLFLAGLTSLDLVRVIGAIEHGYGIRLTAVDILDHPTAEHLAAHLAAVDGDLHG